MLLGISITKSLLEGIFVIPENVACLCNDLDFFSPFRMDELWLPWVRVSLIVGVHDIQLIASGNNEILILLELVNDFSWSSLSNNLSLVEMTSSYQLIAFSPLLLFADVEVSTESGDHVAELSGGGLPCEKDLVLRIVFRFDRFLESLSNRFEFFDYSGGRGNVKPF